MLIAMAGTCLRESGEPPRTVPYGVLRIFHFLLNSSIRIMSQWRFGNTRF
ncbi:hypothetical protein GCM10011391_17370 [Pullulanibacillus camelliae]|uniref:Uncharacterized protein n=1 Tax=Pullulanibacillus camelliae TaxID=1707096 RepID=A0A8J2YD60_9BACL|nr:hypothetical protein GCM10011391_17370 [Pullulanibacillus camelliae]